MGLTKILLIVVDNKKDISKKLTLTNRSHVYCTSESITYQNIKNGIYNYLNLAIITSNMATANKLVIDFPEKEIYFVGEFGEGTTNGNMKINIYNNIYELVFILRKNGDFYTKKEILYFSNPNIENVQKIKLLVILNENKNDYEQNSNIIMKKINNVRYFPEKYIINDIKIFNFKKDFFDNSIEKEISEFCNFIPYNLIDRDKFSFWKKIYDISIDVDVNTYDCIFVIDSVNSTDFMNEDFFTDKIIKIIGNDKEIIYMHEDNIAFGSNKVMQYYMKMYSFYGEYIIDDNNKIFNDNGIIGKDEYEYINNKMSLLSKVQLYQHIENLKINFDSKKLFDRKIENKKNVLVIVTYYGIYDQFINIQESLKKLGYDIVDFPYKKYYDDDRKKSLQIFEDIIKNNKPKIILWWILNMDPEFIGHISKCDKKIINIYFNWDEPYNWNHIEASKKIIHMDMNFITCLESIKRYTDLGKVLTFCQYTGFSERIHYPMNDAKYEHDISFMCTNLYDNEKMYPDKIVDRKKIIDKIYRGQKDNNYKFSIYGPEFLKNHYPESYMGFADYKKGADIINKSKINLCTHVVGNMKGYLNERVFLILACGGLLLVDDVPGVEKILINRINCITICENKIVEQIKKILNDYPSYFQIKKNAHVTSKKYTWDDWAMRIEEKKLKFFKEK
jgi:hypothetical protein